MSSEYDRSFCFMMMAMMMMMMMMAMVVVVMMAMEMWKEIASPTRQRLDPERMCSRQNSQDFPLSVDWTAVVGVANYLFLR